MMAKQVTNSNQLSRLVLKGYKSIAECDLPLGSINVLIGANGAGKSNFISFFKLIGRRTQLPPSNSMAGNMFSR